MDELTQLVFIENDRPVTESLTVAESFGKSHDKVLRDIRELGCSDEFRLANFGESTYVNHQGRKMPMVVLTEKGFTLLAMGYTGQRAMEFKEKYIEEFERMREQLKRDKSTPAPLDERQLRTQLFKAALEHEERLDTVEQRIELVEKKVDEQITLDSGDQRTLQKAVARRVYDIESDPEYRKPLFRELYREIKDRWAVPSYKDVRRTELDDVLRYVDAWRPRIA